MGKIKPKIIVSLTSFPAALPYAAHAVKSIMNQSVRPDEIVLYLTAEQFPHGIKDVPTELRDMRGDLFDIRFYPENIRSYTKLVPALKDFPNDIIITIDDDMYYRPTMIARLLRVHKKYPGVIIGHQIRRIEPNKPYSRSNWALYNRYRMFTRSMAPAYNNLILGYGGMLYPPHSLDKKMIDSKLFMEYAPTVDDIWFTAAAISAGTKVKPLWFGARPKELGKPVAISLMCENLVRHSGVDKNKIALDKILKKYPKIKKRILDRQ